MKWKTEQRVNKQINRNMMTNEKQLMVVIFFYIK